MKIVLTYSSKEGLAKEYAKRHGSKPVSSDCFAEGDSLETIGAVLDALRSGGHDAVGIESDNLVLKQIEKLKPSLVFNMAEGLFGDFRESYIPMICERLGVPYTGSDPLVLAIALNKARTKEILGFHQIPTPDFKVFYPGVPVSVEGISFPAIIKPLAEGSSKGIFDDSVVRHPEEAAEKIRDKTASYGPVLLERFLSGHEFTVALWGNKDVEILPIVGIDYRDLPPGSNPMYSYEAKWIWDTHEKPLNIFQCPAPLTPVEQRRIEETALAAYRVMGIRDWCRIDMRLDEKGEPNILELNPLPGILPDPKDHSCFPKAARTAGMSYEAMINRVVEITAQRAGLI
jgi:D-alanine-D-alanine ligase